MTLRSLVLAAGLLTFALAPQAQPTPEGVERLATPAAAGSGMYALAAEAAPDAGAGPRAVLGWLESTGERTHVLRYAIWERDRWSEAREAARGPGWFANWADHPSVVPAPDGALLAHWLVRSGDGTSRYGYGLRVARLARGGGAWREIFRAEAVADDYAGFLAFLPQADGFAAAYLAPSTAPASTGVPPAAAHGTGHPEPVKTLVWARVGSDGRIGTQDVIDPDVCSCCSVAAAVTRDGPIVAYRDRTAGEIRDIAVVRHAGGRWESPRIVHGDGWMIPGCPTNGPAIAARDARVAVAWFTAAAGVPRVRVAWSIDAGATFAAPASVDDGAPIGWTGVVLLPDGDAAVSWLEGRPGGSAQVRLRRVTPDGRLGAPLVVAEATGGRSTGIPQVALVGDRLLVAWRDGQVQTAAVRLSALASAR